MQARLVLTACQCHAVLAGITAGVIAARRLIGRGGGYGQVAEALLRKREFEDNFTRTLR